MGTRYAITALVLLALVGPSLGADRAWRFDCGTEKSPVAAGYRRLTAGQTYNAKAGFGWEKGTPSSAEVRDFPDIKNFLLYPYMLESLTDLNRDSVVSTDDLTFRLDLPAGTYRVKITLGDMSQALGSIDVLVNGTPAVEHAAAWTPGTRGPGNHRRILMDPYGWWTEVRHTAQIRNGSLRIEFKKNQSYYDRMLAGQERHEAEWDQNYRAHYQRVGVSKPPYFYIGWPFVRHSIMAIEVVPHREPPVVARAERLELTRPIVSPGLQEAISSFNAGNYEKALQSLEAATEAAALPARAIVELWLAGRLELEREKDLIPRSLAALREYVKNHPDENGVAELVADAEIFDRALQLHLTRGQIGKNHFFENVKALGWWWLIQKDSPLYYKSQLYTGRAAHMLIPYFPTRGTEREIFRELEKKFPNNRHVKYHLHYTWEPYGDGSRREDWRMIDYSAKVKNSPEWVRELYPAYANTVDLSEWWMTHRMEPEGGLGGGWGDDVELVGVFAYMGYSSRDVSRILIPGLRKLMEGLWNLSEIDPELGFCLALYDAEHVAEYTGNTLGMMVQIDYGNPVWIERSMKTAQLMRDLWTDYNAKGKRHFRANYFSAAQVGSGYQTNDSWINYRAIRPASAVLWYNRNPAIAKLYTELADAWFASAMSTDRGKPAGIIPAEISFPEGLIGGAGSPNWYTAKNEPGTGNEDWAGASAGYKSYLYDVFFNAYEVTKDARYFEPMRIEHELAARYGRAPAAQTGARLQLVPFDDEAGKTPARTGQRASATAPAEVASERWVAENVTGVNQWLVARRMLDGRKGQLRNDITKADIIRKARWANKELRERWPLMTTEAGPTDRIAFAGCVNPFLIYTGGKIGGPLLEAAVTYGNTTKDFAAAVLATDAQGFRLLYHSLAADTREIEIYPWHLEPASTYTLRFGPDENEDETMDKVIREERFSFPQLGAPIRIRVSPRTTWVVEVDQVERGRLTGLYPDPGLSADDISYDPRWGLLRARIHNVGSAAVRDVEVVAFDGDPKAGGRRIGVQRIPNIEAPNELEPKAVTVGFSWKPTNKLHEIHILIDPGRKISGEITTLNNAAARTLQVDPSRLVFEFRGGQ